MNTPTPPNPTPVVTPALGPVPAIYLPPVGTDVPSVWHLVRRVKAVA